MPNFKPARNIKGNSQAQDSSPSLLNRPTRPFDIPGIHPDVEQGTIQKKPNTTGMPAKVLQKMESRFNTDFSAVKIFPNSSNATKLYAKAYTQGNHIHFAPGKFNPTDPEGLKMLKHELKHVQQQRRGIVKPTRQIKGLPLNEDPELEKQADTS